MTRILVSAKRQRETVTSESIVESLRAGINALSVSSTLSNKGLLCRENHVSTIINFLQEPVHHTLQIFGMPGTGKTATVNHALAALSRLEKQKPTAVCLNGYVIRKSCDIYWTLCQHLSETRWKRTGSSCSADQSASFLEKKLRQSKGGSPLCVIIIDEADKILEKHSKALFRIIDWLHFPRTNLKLITISNSMELNLDAKTKSRLDSTRKLVFEPYRVQELKEILLHRVSPISPPIFAEQAVNLLCHQVASQYGDVRRLLQTASGAICGVLMRLSNGRKSEDFKSYVDGIVRIQDLHAVIRQTFHDRFIEFVKSLISPSIFIIVSVIAHETERLYAQNERDPRVDANKIYMRSQHVGNQVRSSLLSPVTFAEKLELLRQICMIDVSLGADRVPLSGADAIVDAGEDIYVSLLQPYQSVIDSCRLHDLWGAKIGSLIFL